MGGVMHVDWYATVLRQDALAAEVSLAARVALRYGATQYSVHRSQEDRYKISQMAWFENKADWYRYWDGPELVEFRRRNAGHFQIPINYYWYEEIAAGALGPSVELAPEPSPQPEPEGAAL